MQCVNVLLKLQGNVVASVVRWASKKAGGSSRNRKGHAPGKRRGIKAQHGHHVTINSILLRQLHIRCHPGLNVSKLSIVLLLRIHNCFGCNCRLGLVKMVPYMLLNQERF